MARPYIPCKFPMGALAHDNSCPGHYFENELTRGLDYCDGSTDVQHSDKTYWHYDAEGWATRVFDSETPLTVATDESSVQP